jgi:YVTN family beta-propeller protein
MAGDKETLYVADSFADAIYVIDMKGYKVTGSIPLDQRPSGVVIDDPLGTDRHSADAARTR